MICAGYLDSTDGKSQQSAVSSQQSAVRVVFCHPIEEETHVGARHFMLLY